MLDLPRYVRQGTALLGHHLSLLQRSQGVRAWPIYVHLLGWCDEDTRVRELRDEGLQHIWPCEAATAALDVVSPVGPVLFRGQVSSF